MATPQKLTAQAVGRMGDLAVEMELLARGWTVGNFSTTTKNTAGFDLFAAKYVGKSSAVTRLHHRNRI